MWRLADGDALNLLDEPDEFCGVVAMRDEIFRLAALEPVGDVGGAECASRGSSTRPSFIAASIVAHSSGHTPSIIKSRSPRFAQRAKPTARREDSCESAAKLLLDAIANHGERGPCPCSPAASSASNQSSAQLNRSGRGQEKAALAP